MTKTIILTTIIAVILTTGIVVQSQKANAVDIFVPVFDIIEPDIIASVGDTIFFENTYFPKPDNPSAILIVEAAFTGCVVEVTLLPGESYICILDAPGDGFYRVLDANLGFIAEGAS